MISASRKRNIIDSLAIAAISGYQQHLSPRKGFACAHRILYGGESCSQYVKRAIAREGLIEALRLSQQRFAQCKAAHEIRARSRHRDRQHGCSPVDCCNVPVEALDCCGDWDNLGDCGNLDCSPDCGSCSFG
jgi:putative component of membrane protein insertase Oxa1/YidC/SpoIIIJ protein YidD